MKLVKTWMTPKTSKKSYYFMGTAGRILGIVLLAAILIVGGSFLGFYLNLPRKLFSFFLCIAVTGLLVWRAVKIGQYSLQNATAFFLTEDDRLFVWDARDMVPYKKGFSGYVSMAKEIQKYLRQMKKEPVVPHEADEILKVESMQENGSHYVLHCKVRYPNGKTGKHTYFLIAGYEEETLLLHQLERRKSSRYVPESVPNHTVFYLFVSFLCFVACTGICVMSHPFVGKLPQEVYFPCLGADFLSVFFVVYFGIRYRRGE